MRTTFRLVVLLTPLLCAACGESAPPPPAAYPGPSTGMSDGGRSDIWDGSASTDPTPTEARDAAVSSTAAPTPAAETLTDGHILEVVRTANTGEIEQAKLAQGKAKNAKVKAFAAMMLKDHGDANGKTTALSKKTGMETRASSLSASLEADAKKATNDMQPLQGAEFDRAYVDAQVKEHQAVLDAIETKLAPAAQSADVKSLLETVKTKVSHHLSEAKTIQEAVAKSALTPTEGQPRTASGR